MPTFEEIQKLTDPEELLPGFRRECWAALITEVEILRRRVDTLTSLTTSQSGGRVETMEGLVERVKHLTKENGRLQGEVMAVKRAFGNLKEEVKR